VRNQKEIAGKSRITKRFRKRARNDIDSPFSYGIIRGKTQCVPGDVYDKSMPQHGSIVQVLSLGICVSLFNRGEKI